MAQLQIPSPSRYAVSDDPEDTCTNAIVEGVIIWQNCNTARGHGVLAFAAAVLAVATAVLLDRPPPSRGSASE